MTTTPETIAELKRRLVRADGWYCLSLGISAVAALPSLLADLEAAQQREQVLREALRGITERLTACGYGGSNRGAENRDIKRARAALAATEVQS